MRVISDNVHSGHRSRMRRKFSEYGDIFFDDYELLEMLLYFSIPVRDTNPLAKRLLSAFCDLDGVLSATPEELAAVEGIGLKTAEMIALAGRCRSMTDGSAQKEVILDTYERCGRFVAELLGAREDFVTVVLSLDSRMRLVKVDEVGRLDYSSGGVRPNIIADTLIKNRAAVAILAHNHPHGPLYPTEGDLQTNKSVSSVISSVGVILAEHYVVSGKRYVGFMNHIETAYAQDSAIEGFINSKHAAKQS